MSTLAIRSTRGLWHRRALLVGACALGLLTGCAGTSPTASTGMASSSSYTEQGTAAYYSDAYQGKRTASGERYDRRALTAAHRTLPFGTRVRVTNLDNGREVSVRINDRGPFTRRRIIDLSRRAAERLGMLRSGIAAVSIQVEG